MNRILMPVFSPVPSITLKDIKYRRFYLLDRRMPLYKIKDKIENNYKVVFSYG